MKIISKSIKFFEEQRQIQEEKKKKHDSLGVVSSGFPHFSKSLGLGFLSV